ncbi:MAG: T9SS type A sorting domain-containing protein [Candidatus Marinimicrobia bacterium]|nr:T9SS type A sorting domain-containing protein [Candidatus Neomarinimicrobiota bacterium]
MRKIAVSCLVTSLIILTGSILSAQTVWTKDEGNPVLLKGPAESWENVAVAFPEVILDGSTFKMWYVGDDGTNCRIGYATSTDGVSWTKHASNPVLDIGASGSWDDERVSPGAVIFDGSSYKMWYWGYDGANWRTGYATSTDGIDWTKHASNPVMDLGAAGEWDDFWAGISAVIFNGSDYQGWYIGGDGPSFNFRTGYATSPDGITWTKHASNPVMDFSAGEWDNASAGVGAVIYNGSIYEMWYEGERAGVTQIGYATSTDGLVWTKSDSNPVLLVGPFADWDWSHVFVPAVLYDGTSYHLWYVGASSGLGWKIGYATAPKDPITGIADEGVVPEKYELSQNYPNPFNPETVIEYALPIRSKVNLVIYNLRGQEVALLINDTVPAGNHQVNWDASSFASGIYFYRLRSADFTKTKKMLLLK